MIFDVSSVVEPPVHQLHLPLFKHLLLSAPKRTNKSRSVRMMIAETVMMRWMSMTSLKLTVYRHNHHRDHLLLLLYKYHHHQDLPQTHILLRSILHLPRPPSVCRKHSNTSALLVQASILVENPPVLMFLDGLQARHHHLPLAPAGITGGARNNSRTGMLLVLTQSKWNKTWQACASTHWASLYTWVR